MKIKINNSKYDTVLQPTEWRYSAAIVGLVQYLDFFDYEHEYLNNMPEKPEGIISGFDGVAYNQCDVNEEHFLEFAEQYFSEDMTHLEILKILEEDEFDEEKIKRVNELSKKKTVLKNIFGKAKFNGTNKDCFINAINENRQKIIKEIFRYGQNLYANFCNSNLLLTEENPHCRLVGYNVDEGRKTKYLGFCFSKDSFVANDIPEFDFIPFAFSKTYESYFINNNFDIRALVRTQQVLSDRLNNTEGTNPRTKLLTVLKNSDDFIDYDVEIITKNRGEDCYKTLFVRYGNLKALKNISEQHLSFKYKFNDNYWLDVEKEVYERCLNGVLLDDLIEVMLKLYFNKNLEKTKGIVRYKTELLIDINKQWKGDSKMNEINSAKKMGYIISQKLLEQKKENKVISYKQKIIGALVAHDYDRMNEVILSLAAYVGMEFNFAYPLFEAPEENKNIAFAFANALTDTKSDINKTEEN